MDYLGGGGGAKDMLPPPLKLLGGGGWPPAPPPLPTSMTKLSFKSIHPHFFHRFQKQIILLIALDTIRGLIIK